MSHGHGLPLREVQGNLTLTSDTVAGWWRLAGTRWAFMSGAQRAQVLAQAVNSWSALAGVTACDRTRVHLRVTTRPYPAAQWAEDYDAEVRSRAQIPDARAWSEHLVQAQRAMRGQVNLADTEVFLGVDLAPRSLLGKLRRGGSDTDRRKLDSALTRVDHALSQPGLAGVALGADQLEWLIHRSVALHLPTPARQQGALLGEDMFTFTDGVELEQSPSGQSTQVWSKALRGGRDESRHVVVLSMGRPEPLNTPGGHEPFLAYARRLPFPVEISAHLEILTGSQARKHVQRKLDLIRDQIAQRHRNDLDMPPELEIVQRRAIEVRHEMDEGDRAAASRAVGPIRFAVSGATEAEALDRALALQEHYAEYRIPIEHPRAQRALLSEFVPGSRQITPAHTRHMPLSFWVAGVPTLDSTAGTPTGMFLGPTVGASKRPVFFDTHHALYAEQTGFTPIIGELGSGKSNLMGKIVHGAVLRGVKCTVLDPSGTLARLTAMPVLAGLSQHIDLTSAPAGTLNPFALVPLPELQDFRTHSAYADAARETLAAQRVLAGDILKMLLPPVMLKDPRTGFVITYGLDRAARTAGHVTAPGSGRSLGDVVAAIRECDDPDHRAWAKHVAAELAAMQDAPLARLLFAPVSDGANLLEKRAPKALLVLTLAGLVLPQVGSDPDTWTVAERLAVPLMHLAAQLATERAFTANREAPKLLGLDEAHFLAQWSTGRALLARVTRDSRKHRLRVLAASQLPQDVLGHSVGGLTNEVFIGRLEAPDAQAAALQMLRVQSGDGFEAILGGLSQPDPTGRGRAGVPDPGRRRPGRTVHGRPVPRAGPGPGPVTRSATAAGMAHRGGRRVKRLLATVLLAVAAVLAAPVAAHAADVAAAAAQAIDLIPGGGCGGPEPVMPGRGAVGWLAPEPKVPPAQADPFDPQSGTSIYEQYGLSPFTWHTCDLNSRLTPDALDVGSSVTTLLANWIFLLPTLLIALYAALAGVALHPDSWITIIRPALTSTVDALYQGLTLPLAAAVFIALSVVILWRSRSASVSKIATSLLLVVLIGCGLGVIVSDPFRVVDLGSSAAPAVVGGVNNEVSTSPLGKGVSDPAVAAAGNVTESVLYQRWLAGMFGDSTSPAAKRFGPRLFKDSAFTWAEAAQIKASPARAKQLAQAKKDDYHAAMGEVQDADPAAYEYATGRDSTNRLGQALIAIFAAIACTPFLIASMIMLIAVPLVLVAAVVMFVMGGILGVFSGETTKFTLGPLKMAGSAILNAIIFGAATALEVLAANVLLSPDSQLPAWLGVVLVGIMSVILWRATKPWRRFANLAGHRYRRLPGLVKAGVGGWVAGKAAAAAEGRREDAERRASPGEDVPVQPSEQPSVHVSVYDLPVAGTPALPSAHEGAVFEPAAPRGPAKAADETDGVYRIWTPDGEFVDTGANGTSGEAGQS